MIFIILDNLQGPFLSHTKAHTHTHKYTHKHTHTHTHWNVKEIDFENMNKQMSNIII